VSRDAEQGSAVASAAELLRCGQGLEARGDFRAALAFYDEAIATLRALPSDDLELRRVHGVAWMNRGNALQKIADQPSLSSAVEAYDAAIALLRSLPLETIPAHRNHLGAAWLNRGHALLTAGEMPGAIASFEQAIAHLETLPLTPLSDENAAHRLNLAGAHVNRAHASLGPASARSAHSARAALALLAPVERRGATFVEMSLRARRALVMAIGEQLVGARDIAALAAEASDAIDDGLALAREFHPGGALLRPLALRLFRLGAQFYRTHQPHFLAEFVLENLTSAAFGGDAEFRVVAAETIAHALASLQRPQLLVAGTAETERKLATVQTLRAAQAQLSAPAARPPNSPA
jgi:tetratricopeptide (TPR) repeat protein